MYSVDFDLFHSRSDRSWFAFEYTTELELFPSVQCLLLTQKKEMCLNSFRMKFLGYLKSALLLDRQ